MTVGFYSPLPPARTGVADYSAALLEALRARGSVEVSRPGDIDLYHLGNNSLHGEIYRQAIARPGVVVLHDAVLNHFFLGSLDQNAYIDEFVFNYGEWTRDLAAALWRERSRSGAGARYFEYPMLRRIAEHSRAVIVHNPAAARMVARHAPNARVFEIPHLFAAPPSLEEWRVARLRRQMEAGELTCVFGVFGYLRETKRLSTILRTFQRVLGNGGNAKLVIAGEWASSDLARATRPMLGGPGIVKVGYQDEVEFGLWTSAVDCCLNLRFPPAGETSGIAIRLMGIGKAVMLTAGEEIARFPEGACLRVESGPGEEELLESFMNWLCAFPDSAREIGQRARRHILENHGLEQVADRYWSVLEEAAG